MKFNLQLGAKAYHGKSYTVPQRKEDSLQEISGTTVSHRTPQKTTRIRMGFYRIYYPKSDQTIRFLTDFREVNKRIIRTHFPIPKISSILQEMEGFTFATAIDLNMGYNTIRLDSDAQKICTIILLLGKCSYICLPMGISGV